MLMQNLTGKNKECYGIFRSGLWKELDEISRNVNFEAIDIEVRDFAVILLLKKLTERCIW